MEPVEFGARFNTDDVWCGRISPVDIAFRRPERPLRMCRCARRKTPKVVVCREYGGANYIHVESHFATESAMAVVRDVRKVCVVQGVLSSRHAISQLLSNY